MSEIRIPDGTESMQRCAVCGAHLIVCTNHHSNKKTQFLGCPNFQDDDHQGKRFTVNLHDLPLDQLKVLLGDARLPGIDDM